MIPAWGFPGGKVVKNPPANVEESGDAGSVPGSGRSLGEGNGNPFLCSCLEVPWTGEPGYSSWSCIESDMTE